MRPRSAGWRSAAGRPGCTGWSSSTRATWSPRSTEWSWPAGAPSASRRSGGGCSTSRSAGWASARARRWCRTWRAPFSTTWAPATRAAVDRVEAGRVARLAMDGFTRALSPPHLATDGDTLFCLSVGTGRVPVEALGPALADLVARAIVRGVRAATGVAGLPAARDLQAPLPEGEDPGYRALLLLLPLPVHHARHPLDARAAR